MTDINASLKKTIDGEPGPQHKEKGKAEFKFVEGEDGVPYSYDKKVESRLTAIENKLDSVIENGSVNTQLTGSKVAKGIPVQVEKDFIEIRIQGDEIEDGMNQVFDVYANEGEIWTLKRFGYNTGRNRDLEGIQMFYIYHGERSSNENFVMNISNNASSFMRGTIPGRREPAFSGNINPENTYEMVETIRDTTVLSDKLPLRIQYRNRGGGSMPPCSLTLLFLVEKVNNIGGN